MPFQIDEDKAGAFSRAVQAWLSALGCMERETCGNANHSSKSVRKRKKSSVSESLCARQTNANSTARDLDGEACRGGRGIRFTSYTNAAALYEESSGLVALSRIVAAHFAISRANHADALAARWFFVDSLTRSPKTPLLSKGAILEVRILISRIISATANLAGLLGFCSSHCCNARNVITTCSVEN
jgi:hypothetical protein